MDTYWGGLQKQVECSSCVGAPHGRHVAIRKPAKSSSLYHTYKGFFSVVLMALVDGDYTLLWVDISAYGSMSDAQIFKESELKDYMYVCMYVYMYVCMYVCIHVCMYVRMYVCMYVCRYVCMYVCIFGWLYVCMYVRM